MTNTNQTRMMSGASNIRFITVKHRINALQRPIKVGTALSRVCEGTYISSLFKFRTDAQPGKGVGAKSSAQANKY